MKTIHTKSPCCKAKIYIFGDRRRQCSVCKKTWRIRIKKRGRKIIRVHPSIQATVIKRKESLRNKAKRLNKSRELIRRRHKRNLDLLLKTVQKPKAPKGQLIAVIDGWCTYFRKQRYVLYLILLRSVKGKKAIVMEPLLLPDWEHKDKWAYAFNQLPQSVRNRIKAVVLDGLTGLECLAQAWGLVVQRCHFHQLSALQSMRGRKWSTIKHKEFREQIYQNVVKILRTNDNKLADKLAEQTKYLLQKPACSKWFKEKVKGALRRIEFFRAYRNFPELNLPITTNSAECVCRMITETVRLTRGFSNPKSFEKWIKIQIRTMKPIQCNGNNFHRINVS